MDATSINWEALKRLRKKFLAESSSDRSEYWESEALLEAYDLTFATRIGWKWEAVLRDVTRKGWAPEPGYTLVDWGCGTGIAARTWLGHFRQNAPEQILLWDRSAKAMDFATRRLREAFPKIPQRTYEKNFSKRTVLLLSHVLNELEEAHVAELEPLLAQASVVVWVEPGTPAISRQLVKRREKLRQDFYLVAPCPHQAPCGLLEISDAKHWCHQFAEVPGEIFQSAFWKKFSVECGVDLRSLPVSYFIADRKRLERPGSAKRVLGRARLYKGYAQVLTCTEEGIIDEKILKRENAEKFKRLKEGGFGGGL